MEDEEEYLRREIERRYSQILGDYRGIESLMELSTIGDNFLEHGLEEDKYGRVLGCFERAVKLRALVERYESRFPDLKLEIDAKKARDMYALLREGLVRIL